MKLARILATGLISLGAISAFAQNISFGIIATDSASAQRERWEPFFRDMEKKTGLKISNRFLYVLKSLQLFLVPCIDERS